MPSVKEIQHLAKENEDKTLRIYNPDTDDFTCIYHNKPYTISALDMSEFPMPIAKHIKKHLGDHLLHKRGEKINPQDDLRAIYKEIEVKI